MEKTILDVSLGASAVTSPYWLEALNTGLGLAMAVVGLTLLTLRLVLAWREYKRGQDG